MKLITSPFAWFWRRKWYIKLTVLIICAVLIVGFHLTQKKNAKDSYNLEKAIFGDVTEFVSETGHVSNAGATPVYSTITGVVDAVFVENNQFIEKDTPLFSVKSTATKQEQESALAAYLTAKSALESAKATQLSLQSTMLSKWDTYKELAESDEYENDDGTPKHDQRTLPEFHIPEKEWLAAEAAYKNQQHVIQQAQVNAGATWKAYQSTQDGEVVALSRGIVKNLSIGVGSQVSIDSVVEPVPPALVLFDESNPRTVVLSVGESDAVKIKPNQPAQIVFDALDEQIFEGRVLRIDSLAEPINSVVNFSVYVSIDNPSVPILGGMTADVDIEVDSKQNVLTVPSTAVKPYEGKKAVRVVGADGEIEFVPVEVGLKGYEGTTEILSGISEGTEVIVALSNDQVKRSGGLF